MTVTITIEGLVAIERAKFAFDGVALIVGLNEAGKTTIADAVASVMIADPLMRRIKQKARLGGVVRTGHGEGRCAVEFANSEAAAAVMSWPDGRIESVGDFPPCSAEVVGRVKLLQIDDKERAKRLGAILDVLPQANELLAAVVAADVSEVAAKEVVRRVVADGWDAALAHYEGERKRLKGQWEGVTGANYGSKIAESWVPDGWEDDLVGASGEDLLFEADTAKGSVAALISSTAFDAGARQTLEADASKYKQLADHVAALEEEAIGLQGKVIKIQDAIHKLPSLPGVDSAVRCPLCSGRLLIDKRPGVTELNAAPPIAEVSPENLKDLRERHAKGAGALANAEDAIKLKLQEIGNAKRYRDVALSAKKRLAAMGEKAAETPSADVIGRAEAALKRANDRLSAFNKKTAAEARHRAVLGVDSVVHLLAPDGLRKKRLSQALEGFNSTLEDLSLQAGLGSPVRLTHDLEAYMGQRPYGLLSAGAQYMVDAVLQVAVAKKQEAPIVIMDGSEVVVGKRMSGLLTMLTRTGIPTIVCRAVADRSKVPDLGKSGDGLTLWVENGGVA